MILVESGECARFSEGLNHVNVTFSRDSVLARRCYTIYNCRYLYQKIIQPYEEDMFRTI